MAGIEQAFKDFVKRVSEKENQEQVSEERGYQYGGGAIGYSDGGYPPVEDPTIANEFGNNMGIINYPITFGNLGIRPRVNIQSGMTSSPDPYTRIKMSNQNYGADIGYQMTDNLSATGNIDYNRSSVKQDYNVPYFDQYGNKVFEDRGSMRDVYKSPMDVRLGLNYQTPQTNANISVNPRTRDLMARYNYSFADGGGVETLFRPKYAEGGQSFITGDYPISEHVIPIDPISIGSNTIPMMPASKSEISGSRIGEKKAMDELSNKGTPFEYGNIKGTIYPKEPIYNIKTEQPDLAITKLTSKETNFLKNQFYKNREDLEIGDVHILSLIHI